MSYHESTQTLQDQLDKCRSDGVNRYNKVEIGLKTAYDKGAADNVKLIEKYLRRLKGEILGLDECDEDEEEEESERDDEASEEETDAEEDLDMDVDVNDAEGEVDLTGDKFNQAIR